MASELRATNVCTNHEIVFANGECDLCKLLAELASRDELVAKLVAALKFSHRVLGQLTHAQHGDDIKHTVPLGRLLAVFSQVEEALLAASATPKGDG